MSNIISFDGYTVLDMDPDKVLEEAAGKLEAVVVVGVDPDGNPYVASSYGNEAQAGWLLDKGKKFLLELDD